MPAAAPDAGDAAPTRAVLDTNILVAYALLGAATARRHDALRRCVDRVRGSGGLVGTRATLAELDMVLMRSCFDRYVAPAERRRFLDAIARETTLVDPAPVGRLCRDPEDDMFLAAAAGGAVPWLVTVDRQLLSVRRVGEARVLRPERFLEAVGQSGGPGDSTRQTGRDF
ncbi:putative toxin-antitoxin system toxin component, PIN family [Azospirillum picis]|uniref:PIN family toxin of toxin-antitoxin system n=1 Tax=Azospirillum picis TaxID=488438 RepID=A0ABU0MKR4_9PROT|nr:putative toxin-antitoxin system toxin component, PIN family [Azospirillum picis]MBP2300090.1 putative PIN family toxin of toxin-antitoxin system [Azospirillum picis]MDQ0534068.1 putative PIN family toxin of toxin-antitoxin system [Azospirillum picis]